ncbi:MAG: histidine kinase [Desulfovibrionaceae bacterium]|nr:histidine kinase [Desulfovibrionaceae bacterium]
MSETLLDWHTALDSGAFKEADYQKKLRAFIEKERDTGSYVVSALQTSKLKEAQKKVHDIKKKATELFAKQLAASAFSLEMALKAGADFTVSLKQFDAVLMDTLLAMSAYLNR